MTTTRFGLAATLLTLTLAACNGQQSPTGSPTPGASAGPASQASPASPASLAPSAAPAENATAEGCEHLKQGPAVAVAAVAEGAASTPSIAADHHRYDVALTGGVGQVRYASALAGELNVFLNPAATVVLKTADGSVVAPEFTASSVPECGEVKAKFTYDVGIGVHTLVLRGPAQVGVVLEAGAHNH